MSERGALRSRAHALAITGVLALGVFAAIVLASSAPSAPVAPARSTAAPLHESPITAPAATHPAISKNDAAARRASLPLYFEPNVGQSDPHVRFLSQSSRYSLFLTDDGGGVLPGRRPDSQGPRAGEGDGQPAAPAASRPAGRVRRANPDGRGEPASRDDRAGATGGPRQLPDRKRPRRSSIATCPTYGRVRVSERLPRNRRGLLRDADFAWSTTSSRRPAPTPRASASRSRAAPRPPSMRAAISKSAPPPGTIAMHKPRAYQRAADGSEIPVESSFVAAKGTERGPSIRFGSRVMIARVR